MRNRNALGPHSLLGRVPPGPAIRLSILFSLLVNPVSSGVARAQTTPAAAYLGIPVESPLYDDLEHFRSLGFWQGSLEMRPMRRDEFERAVAAVRSAAETHRLSDRDQQRLRALEAAIGPWSASRPRLSPVDDDPPARAEIYAAVRFAGTAADLDSLADLDRRSRREQCFLLGADAALGAHVFAQWRFYEDYDALTPFRPGNRWADNLPPRPRQLLTSPSARNDRAVLGAGWNWGEVRYGREDRRWGTGRRGTLFLSENPFPLDGLSARFHTRYLAGTSLLAQLRRGNPLRVRSEAGADSTAAASTGDSWLASHRIELRPRPNLRLGLFEAAVWTGRGIDLAYANPVSFIVAVTQDLYDRARVDDKKVVGFDVAADVAPVSLYAEMLLNRIVTLDADQGPQSEATTWAQLAGLRWADPAGLAGADLDLEYAHLDPEVYFHKDHDPGRALLSEGELVGHWLGPNADSFHAALTMPVGERLGTAQVSFERSRWGVINGKRGSDLGFFSFRKRDKRWITGRIEEERTVAAQWRPRSFSWSARVFLDAEARLARVDRSGMRTRDGWQAELRLTCRVPVQAGE